MYNCTGVHLNCSYIFHCEYTYKWIFQEPYSLYIIFWSNVIISGCCRFNITIQCKLNKFWSNIRPLFWVSILLFTEPLTYGKIDWRSRVSDFLCLHSLLICLPSLLFPFSSVGTFFMFDFLLLPFNFSVLPHLLFYVSCLMLTIWTGSVSLWYFQLTALCFFIFSVKINTHKTYTSRSCRAYEFLLLLCLWKRPMFW